LILSPLFRFSTWFSALLLTWNLMYCGYLSSVSITNSWIVKYKLTGREYAGKYYNTIVAWNISIKDVDKEMEKATNKINQILKQNNVNLSDENIDIPF